VLGALSLVITVINRTPALSPMSNPYPIHIASLAALTALAALTQPGCSGGCSDAPWTSHIKPISFQAWERSGRTSCDPTKFSAGLTGGADKCPVGDAAREYILNCSIGLAALEDLGGAQLCANALPEDRAYCFEIGCRGAGVLLRSRDARSARCTSRFHGLHWRSRTGAAASA
jgi:hypothetical protein